MLLNQPFLNKLLFLKSMSDLRVVPFWSHILCCKSIEKKAFSIECQGNTLQCPWTKVQTVYDFKAICVYIISLHYIQSQASNKPLGPVSSLL